ncbi:MAG: hypothetical protein HC929_14980 [Leptolyngbyaceae cyanobacterium SM2_5_2]|nr:hypothetical protein [Leptolyngbyaceae cyanobacterium SM2_5_2]
MSRELSSVSERSVSERWVGWPGWAKLALQVIDMRLALVMGLLAFLITVSFDAARNPAEASDFTNRARFQAGLLPVTVVQRQANAAQGTAKSSLETATATSAQATDSQTQLHYSPHHGMITSASVVDDRITAARFLSGQPFD